MLGYLIKSILKNCQLFDVTTIDFNLFNVYIDDMEYSKSKRTYQMTTRADLVSKNEQNIMKATVKLWKELSINDITLELIAKHSGVTVRTILRKWGSKEGLFEACIDNDASNIRKERALAPQGDVSAALKILLDNYEENGDAAIRTLAVEEELSIAKKILTTGRTQHRHWCAHVFAPYLPDTSVPNYEVRLLAFITATEIYLWKLLRRDLHKSYDETFTIFQHLVDGLVQKYKT
jgi:AcrR family transcriptional regulator